MSEAARSWGAHAPRVLRLGPSPIARPEERNFGEGAEKCTPNPS